MLLYRSPEGVGCLRYVLDLVWENRNESQEKQVKQEIKIKNMLAAVKDIYISQKG